MLAVGVTRGWRVALTGAGCAVLALAALVLIGGPALVQLLHRPLVELLVGLFLMWFGFGWLRKAILRYAGRMPQRDENVAYERSVAKVQAGDVGAAFAASFQGVLLEGIEVVIIVVAVGSKSTLALEAAAIGAVAAFLVVAVAGFVLHQPLSRVPENALKFVVGIMLMSIGTYWAGEGLGVKWWGGDLAIVLLIASYVVLSYGTVRVLRRTPAGA